MFVFNIGDLIQCLKSQPHKHEELRFDYISKKVQNTRSIVKEISFQNFYRNLFVGIAKSCFFWEKPINKFWEMFPFIWLRMFEYWIFMYFKIVWFVLLRSNSQLRISPLCYGKLQRDGPKLMALKESLNINYSETPLFEPSLGSLQTVLREPRHIVA